MALDTSRWCRDCQSCQRAKVTKKPRATIQPMGIPAQLFSHLHIDLVGPLPRRDTTTSSPSWTDHPVGWRPFPSPAPPQRPSPKLLWPAGWPDSVFRSTSPPTGGHSSVQRCGPSSHATSATCTISPQPTIPRPTAWWKDATANSRTLSVPAPLAATGCLIFFGSFWDFELLHRSTQVFLQLRWLMAPPWSCPARYPVFKEDISVAPPFIPSRGPATSPPDFNQIPKQLQEATFVYVCRGGSKPPLPPAYSGPFVVVSRSPKYCILFLT